MREWFSDGRYWLTYWIIMATVISTAATYIVLQRKAEWERLPLNLCLLIAAPAFGFIALAIAGRRCGCDISAFN